MSCYPFLGLLSGVMQHLQYYCFISYSVLVKHLLKCDVTPVLALTRFTHVTFFCCPIFTPFGSTVSGKGNKIQDKIQETLFNVG